MIGLAGDIDAGLADETASREALRDAAASKARDIAATTEADGTSSGPARQPDPDYAEYLRRSDELDRRIAAGESITDIMRAEQRARGEARIREILAEG
jgi:hypothetical protein